MPQYKVSTFHVAPVFSSMAWTKKTSEAKALEQGSLSARMKLVATEQPMGTWQGNMCAGKYLR